MALLIKFSINPKGNGNDVTENAGALTVPICYENNLDSLYHCLSLVVINVSTV